MDIDEEMVEPLTACQHVRVGDVLLDADLLLRQIQPCGMGECRGRCCRFGALVSSEEQERIQGVLPRLLPMLRPSARETIRRSGWCFQQEVRERYASSATTWRASRVAEGVCVFVMDREQGGCALHGLALQDGVPVERYKPLECLLFPLNALQGQSVFLHQWNGYPCTHHDPAFPPAYQSLSQELRLILGEQGYEAMLLRVRELRQRGVLLEPPRRQDPPPVRRGRPPTRAT